MSVQFEYDEDNGNGAEAGCLLRISTDTNFYISTEGALPWKEPADAPGDAMVIDAVWIESLVRKAKVSQPNTLSDLGCLSVVLNPTFINEWLSVLVDETGLLGAEDGDEDAVRDYQSFNELQDAADACWEKIFIDSEFSDYNPDVDDTAFDVLHQFAANTTGAWLNDVSVEELSAPTGDLSLYVDLMKMVGPHAVNDQRNRAGSQFVMMTGGGAGGQLAAVVKDYYLGPARDGIQAPPQMIAYRVPAFLKETQWPYPYALEFPDQRDYAFDLSARAKWNRATRLEWTSLVHSRIVVAVGRLSVLAEIMRDIEGEPAKLVKEVQRLGDVLLKGDTSQKLPFWRITEVEDYLARNLRGLVVEARAAGADTVQIIDRLLDVVQQEAPKDKGERVSEGLAIDSVEHTPPRRGQIVRALGERTYAKLERTFLPILQEAGQPRKVGSDLLSECFKAESVLPKAVLLATPGMRVSAYTQQSDFLDLLKDERNGLRLYFGQCLAYDEDTEEVPHNLRAFELEKAQYEMLRRFEWDKMDPLNTAVLKMRAKEVGTQFRGHDASQAYHDGDMMGHITLAYSQLFGGLGYPEKVPDEEGLTYTKFMKRMRRFHKSSLAMGQKEARAILKIMDTYIREGYEVAAAHAKSTIYSANPADRKLRAWIPAGVPLLLRIEDSLGQLSKIEEMRVGLPGVIGSPIQARMLPGFGLHDGSVDEDERLDPRTRGKRGPKRSRLNDGAHNEPGGSSAGGGMGALLFDKDKRLEHNPKNIFFYDDGTFSLKQWHFKWPAICHKFGWDADKLCGPVVMARTSAKNREHNCMDPHHRQVLILIRCATQTLLCTPQLHEYAQTRIAIESHTRTHTTEVEQHSLSRRRVELCSPLKTRSSLLPLSIPAITMPDKAGLSHAHPSQRGREPTCPPLIPRGRALLPLTALSSPAYSGTAATSTRCPRLAARISSHKTIAASLRTTSSSPNPSSSRRLIATASNPEVNR